MPLVSPLKQNITEEGEEEAFSLGLAFSEKEFLFNNLTFICTSLRLESATVHLTTDEGVPETPQQLSMALPGKPLIFFG